MSDSTMPSETVIPIMEEMARVHRTVVETGAVRVRVRTTSRTEIIDEPVLIRGVSVERVPRGTFVEERIASWTEGDVMVVPVYEEVIVKKTRLIEELRLTPTLSVHHEAQSLDLRSESAVFERQGLDGAWHEVPISELRSPQSE